MCVYKVDFFLQFINQAKMLNLGNSTADLKLQLTGVSQLAGVKETGQGQLLVAENYQHFVLHTELPIQGQVFHVSVSDSLTF